MELALAAAAACPRLAAGAWADAGTGSGCLAVGLARGLDRLAAATKPNTLGLTHSLPPVIALDVNDAPLAYAAFNAARCGVGGRVRVLRSDWLGALSPLSGGGDAAPCLLDGLVSNPPYVPGRRVARLQREVAAFEPRAALDGGDSDGGGALRALVDAAAAALRPGAFLGLETDGGDQARGVAELLRSAGGGAAWERVAVESDLAGVARFVVAYRAHASVVT